MKNIKRIISIALAVITIFGTFAIAANAASYTYQVNTYSGVNVRSGAGSNYAVVGTAANGTSFKVSKISGSWGYTSSIRCTNGTRSGWVSLNYCRYTGTNSGTSSTKYYTLTYNANGGKNAPSAQKIKANSSFYISSTMPTRSGYSFLGWSTSNNATSADYCPNQKLTIKGDVTIFAVWAKGSVKINYASAGTTEISTYYIKPKCASNSVLDVKDANTADKTNIQIWKKNCYSKNQRWEVRYYGGSGYCYFIDNNSGKALTIENGKALNGTNVSISTSTKSDSQLFKLVNAGNGYYYIQSKLNPAYYLDVSTGSSANGTNVQLYQFNGTSAQAFKFSYSGFTTI